MAVLASEVVSTVGGREGRSTSADGKFSHAISPPGSGGPGTNPEQLFAAGWSACFGGALGAAAALEKVPLRGKDTKVTATVNLNKEETGYTLSATINAELPGIDQAKAEALVAKAHTICPYSKATKGNVKVALQANGKPVKG
jgi:Ohr subfamily peroxiredoxin